MKKFLIYLIFQSLLFSSFSQFSIKGKILDENGMPLFGANVQIDNTFLGSISDNEGNYSLGNVKKGNCKVFASYIGYESFGKTLSIEDDLKLDIILKKKDYLTDEIIVSATRVGEKSAIAFSTLSKDELLEQNFGQDIPYLLNTTPSLVTTSDAGTGIGYTNFRIRGTDMNRINVTLNGIPVNDAESHGVWWVDLPDLAESVDNIQIQRGVGTSTNGAGSFGATINLQTTTLNKDPYAKISSSGGSFNTIKNSVSVGSGLINRHFTIDVRLSKINSKGYIDRAWVDLKSFFITGGYYSQKSVLRINVFSGFEETYQAWWGVPSVRINNDKEGMLEYFNNWLFSEKEYLHMLNSDSRKYNYYTYDNQIDHYKQDHYQILFSHEINANLNLNLAGHYTSGKGYYEQFQDKDFLYDDVNLITDYKMDSIVLSDTTIYNTNLIRRKWLDNDFYGITGSLNLTKGKLKLIFGGSWNKYDGKHFGRVKWAEFHTVNNLDHEWYSSTGIKTDFNFYAKAEYQLSGMLNLFADLQLRNIEHKINGVNDDFSNISQLHSYTFINPKFGLFNKINEIQSTYFSFGVANREPNRSNFIDADTSNPVPSSEKLYDYEIGYKLASRIYTFTLNLYYMDYANQLVMTGKINDVGSAIMINVENSYRAGIELSGGFRVNEKLFWNSNLTLSRNKIGNFIEYVDNWDTGVQNVKGLGETDISFSPNVIANSTLKYKILNFANVSLISNYVSNQYIDNTSNSDRILEAYFVNNLRFDFNFNGEKIKKLSFHFLINNLLNSDYESNAWVYRYILGDKEYKQDGYFPQAGIHFFAGVKIKF